MIAKPDENHDVVESGVPSVKIPEVEHIRSPGPRVIDVGKPLDLRGTLANC